jgi:hypothetical protein
MYEAAFTRVNRVPTCRAKATVSRMRVCEMKFERSNMYLLASELNSYSHLLLQICRSCIYPLIFSCHGPRISSRECDCKACGSTSENTSHQTGFRIQCCSFVIEVPSMEWTHHGQIKRPARCKHLPRTRHANSLCILFQDILPSLPRNQTYRPIRRKKRAF